jgi:SAM-dependent methyltransferase
MSEPQNMIYTRLTRKCPICALDESDADLFAQESIDSQRISNLSFASRKSPELMSYRLIRCRGCDLVYTPSPPTANELGSAYHLAGYDSNTEAIEAAVSYKKSCIPIIEAISSKTSALEIGTGNGIFLEILSDLGFQNIVGIEPSLSAINSATPTAKKWIINDVFKEDSFEPTSFDLICCFMTLEHVHDPAHLINSAYKLLKNGGVLITVVHDYRSIINRLMGLKSPIIDIEHMQLFSKTSINELYKLGGFKNISCSSFVNTYSLRYWIKLAPLPKNLKREILKICERINLSDLKISINVGNIFTAGYKPETQEFNLSSLRK